MENTIPWSGGSRLDKHTLSLHWHNFFLKKCSLRTLGSFVYTIEIKWQLGWAWQHRGLTSAVSLLLFPWSPRRQVWRVVASYPRRRCVRWVRAHLLQRPGFWWVVSDRFPGRRIWRVMASKPRGSDHLIHFIAVLLTVLCGLSFII